ncbi:MAG: VCBS repeat-containing protein, partial [Acidobacteria bacterium]|nr:VCBS repeat-containing protein [Acidobacteriota bacterium]
LHRGNVSALWPRSQKSEVRSQKSDSSEESTFDPRSSILDPQAFHPEARVFEVPEAPEFLGAGDFDNDGHWDVVAAVRGSDALYLLPGDGRGGFVSAKSIALPGAVTTLTTGEINRRDGLMDVVVSIIGRDGPEVLIFEWPEGALRGQPEVFPLPAEATALALGQLDDSYEMDLVVAAGSELLIVHGRDRKLSLDDIRRAEVRPASIDQRSFPFAITSLALGDFIWDKEHRTEIAVLSGDGTVHVLQRSERENGRKGEWAKEDWEIAELSSPTHPLTHAVGQSQGLQLAD